MNQMNINKSNGLKFEARFLKELQSRFKTAKTSHSTDYMYICDIVHDDCLIELKSNRDAYEETTKQTFKKICKVGLKAFRSTGIKKGLFFQALKLLEHDRAMIIVGNYQIEPNKLHNLFIKNPDQAWHNYNEYKILTHSLTGSSYTRMSSKEFWRLVDTSNSLLHLQEKIENYNGTTTNKFLGPSNMMTCPKFDSAFWQLELWPNKLTDLETNKLKAEIKSKSNKDWGVPHIKELQPWWRSVEIKKQPKLEPVKEVAEPVKEIPNPVEQVAKRTDGYTYPIIEQKGSKPYYILLPKNLKRIEDGIRNQVKLSDLSIEFGKSPTYLHATLCNYESYKSEEWVIYKKWLLNLMEEVDYKDQPTTTMTSLKRAQNQVSKYKREMTKLEYKLERQEKSYKKTIEKLKGRLESGASDWLELPNTCKELQAKLASQETSQVDETAVLKIEAYQAEIKRLQAELKYKNEVYNTHQANLMKIDSLEKLCSKQVREISNLKQELQDALSQSKNEAIINVSMDEVERYKRIIDMMLDKQC